MALSCPNCQTQLPDDAIFCPECGKQVATPDEKPKPRFCLQCGVQLTENAKFCLACGVPVTETEDETSWFEKKDKAFEKEMIKGSPLFDRERITDTLDFENTKYEIWQRAQQWAEYAGKRMGAPEWFNTLWMGSFTKGKCLREPYQEDHFFPTNKPNAHKALVLRAMNEWFIEEARRRGYIDYDGNFSQTVITYFELTHTQEAKPGALADWLEQGWKFKADFSELDELAKKDDELFPPPEQLRVEVAGAVLNFTTDEGVLVVYADCAHKGKTVEIDKFSESFIWSDYLDRKAEIIERTCDNTVLCSAIFNHIPFVTNHHRHYQQVLKQMDCTIRSLIPAGFKNRWEETVTLFRGHVTELDWRGRRA